MKLDSEFTLAFGNKCILLIVLFMLSCHEEKISMEKDINELLSSNILAEALHKYEKNNSMDEVADFIKSEYKIDYDEQYKKLMPYFNTSKSFNANFRTLSVSMSDFGAMLENAGIPESSKAYDYLIIVSNLFEDGLLTEEQVLAQMSELRTQIQNDNTIEPTEKENLIIVSTLLENNFNGMVDNIYENEGGTTGGRTKGWLKKAWRIVRSVVLTAGVGALIGSTVNPYGAIVGAIVMGAVAITDSVLNDNCHFAMQCDGGWRQDCTSGDCKPF